MTLLSVLLSPCSLDELLVLRRNSMRYLNRLLLAATFFACGSVAFAQTPPMPPALLFKETWLQPPGAKPFGQGDGTDDVVTRLTPTCPSS
jgi:hypothetical protein